MRQRWWIALTGLALGMTGCAAPLKTHQLDAGKTYRCRLKHIRFNGVGRTYRLHIPAGYAPDTARPLVVVIHGAFSNSKKMEALSGFSRLADQEKFIVLYPDGIGLFGFLQHWNAGHCCGKAAADQVNDIDFIWSVVEDTASRLSIDRSRIYVVGFSNGGMLTHRIGAELPDKIAAIASIAGAIGGKASPEVPLWRIPAPTAPLPVMIMHGLKDKKVPYAGGPVDGEPGKREYLSIDAAVGFWTRHNHCRLPGIRKAPYGDAIDITIWQDCADSVEVVRYAFAEVGHTWPEIVGTDPSHHHLQSRFDAAEAIWGFFKQYQLRDQGRGG